MNYLTTTAGKRVRAEDITALIQRGPHLRLSLAQGGRAMVANTKAETARNILGGHFITMVAGPTISDPENVGDDGVVVMPQSEEMITPHAGPLRFKRWRWFGWFRGH